GIRARVTVNGDSAELWLQFHHSCCDGIAGVAFLKELLEAYGRPSPAGGSRDDAADFPEYCCAYSRLTSREKAQRFARDLPRIWRFFFRRVLSLPATVADATTPSDSPSYVEARMPLTPEMRARLKRAHVLPTSINDILLRDVFLALKDSTSQLPPSANRQWLRIAVPTNHRDADVPIRGCRNDMGMAFLDLRVEKSQSKAESLRDISQEMTLIKRHRMGNSMLGALNYMRYAPGAMARVLAMQERSTTVVVSNLGKVLATPGRHGPLVTNDVIVKRLGFLVPIREGTPISFGAFTYADELTVCMQYDERVIDRVDADRLLARVVNYLRDSLAAQPHKAA
ncbi:MAG: WS/DGAT domain-containing protein, partial [Planctomycetota bacterium]